jgi:hypothetical protein
MMSESSVEYGLPPENLDNQQKVRELFRKTWVKLEGADSNNPSGRKKIKKAIQGLMDKLDCLRVELPCQGVVYGGVVVGRDPEVYEDTLPAPFGEWGKALGVPSDLFESEE